MANILRKNIPVVKMNLNDRITCCYICQKTLRVIEGDLNSQVYFQNSKIAMKSEFYYHVPVHDSSENGKK